MEVILRQYVEHLGKRGDVVKVAAGYARNYLLPRKLALPATDGNKRHVERERKIMEVKEADEKSQAQAVASRLEAVDVVITRRVGDTDQLYGSVTSADIAEFLKGKGFEIDRRKLILPEPIKAVGTHPVPLKLHRDVTVTIKVQVAKEGAAATSAPPAAEATQ
jgi:large subunit ribosomal protein L9